MKNKSNNNSGSKKTAYHHGDLKGTLVNAALQMLQDGGIEALSLRKLADKVGVSRTAPYHHFQNKNELLCALAEFGFKQWRHQEEQLLSDPNLKDSEKFSAFVHGYIQHAIEHPKLYDLMFGNIIWQEKQATQSLQDVAYPSFQYQVTLIKQWQHKGILPKQHNSLRLAQVTWATMHGIARLIIDGVYADSTHVKEMCDTAVALIMASTGAD